MENQKIENQLNLAIDVTEKVREKSLDLNVGFSNADKTWEVIVKYYGTGEGLEQVFRERFPDTNIRIENLSSNYGILKIPEELVDSVADLPEIEYMEKPKRLFFAVNGGKSASCINSLQTGANNFGQMGTVPIEQNDRNNLI